jgi:N-acetylglucosaminyldiphosphoundecaprenol N-acetyl-beta-D-mannosaminyltransferase
MPDVPSPRLSAPRSCIAILGVPFDCVTLNDAIGLIDEMVQSRRPHFLATADMDFVVQALEDDELRRILFDAHLVVCDGQPLLKASRRLGNELPEAIAGTELVPLMLRLAATKGYRAYFLGDKPKVLETAVQNITQQYPGLIVAGTYSPPAAPLHEMDHEAIAKRIREVSPDMLFVSFGFPKEEKWIAMNYRALNVPVSIGAGAAIDFLAGEKSAIEGLARSFKGIRDSLVFNGAIRRQVKQLGKPKGGEPASGAASARTRQTVKPEPNMLILPENVDAAFVHGPSCDWDARAAAVDYLFVDAAKVNFIDSTGVGSLVRLQKTLREKEGRLILFNITAALEKALSLMKLNSIFPSAQGYMGARAMVAQFERERETPVKWGRPGAKAQISWTGEVTVSTIEDLWKKTEEILIARNQAEPELVVDLSGVTFLDSSGLGSMVRMRRTARQNDVDLRFLNPSEVVKRVARISKLDEFLFGTKQ